jgi:uncharacterized membrane protein
MGRFPKVLLFLALLGIAVSSYLTYHHYDVRQGGSSRWCEISEEISCDTVALSDYSEIAGIPVAVLGLLWFTVVVLIYYSDRIGTAKRLLGSSAEFYLFLWSLMGLGFISWLVYAELFLIFSICLACTIAHVLLIAILVISYFSLKRPIYDYVKNMFFE